MAECTKRFRKINKNSYRYIASVYFPHYNCSTKPATVALVPTAAFLGNILVLQEAYDSRRYYSSHR